MIDKRVKTLAEAVAGVKDGATVLCSGFGAVGEPVELLNALRETGVRDLVCVANNAGTGDEGLASLIRNGRVRKIICSFPRTTDPHCFEAAYKAGQIELEIVPQGTLSERMRAGAAGIGGFFVKTAAGTKLGDGKETREIGGELYVLEAPIRGDVALCRAERADRWGNLTYRKSARNFNPVMAMAADLTVVQVREMVALGAFDAECVVTPGIFVDRIVVV
ncbi:MAG TPA: 3-oxoacid CoA-transferase subunit A [Stellaceae bacterium]|jgi:3-oxoadipate CoA-transferase alpha subunit|nr:3-oxoacid CoA-transferase subunit A [Stellaceae bacterium]